jgi:galactosylceramidase
MTKTIIWSLVTSYYDVLPLPDSGPMKAKEPWSGHFEVQPGVWSIAHTTQFAQPGWRYLDRACGVLSQGGSVVTLVGPDTNAEVSVIIETMDATVPQTVAFRLRPGAPVRALRVWRSTERSQFDRLPDVDVAEGRFTITVEPDAIYSLTTTKGQTKGQYAAPRSREFPLPYADNFEAYPPGKYARYFSDQGGVFEVARRPDDAGQCLRQVIPQNGIDWHYHPTPEPHSLLGSVTWRNYAVRCDVRVEQAGSASIWGRISCSPQTDDPAHGYRLRLDTAGRWSLHSFTNVVAQGDAAFAADRWHRVELRFAGARIRGLLDGARLFELADFNEQRGLAALGTGWNTACFDNFAVQPVPANEVVEPVNLVRGATLSASSQAPEGLEAWRAGDRRGETRWLAAPGPGLGEWLQIDFGKPVRVGAVYVRQYERRIEKYRVQHWDGSQWVDSVSREQREMPEWTDVFPAVETARLRLYVLGTKKGLAPSIWEIEAYDTGGAGAASPAKP